MPRYAIARFPTPVLTTSAFSACFGGEKGDTLPLDSEKLLRPIEIILFPGSKIELKENIGSSLIWRISTKEYPYQDKLYIDERFVAFAADDIAERKHSVPSCDSIIDLLKKQMGSRYIWGGNWPEGIPQLLQWYRPSVNEGTLDPLIHATWQLKGVDCSGLLYYATNGSTPRNTSQLIEWGTPIPISGKSSTEIAASLLPLDLIVWKGHVVIVLDAQTAIESKGGIGVIASPLKARLEEILAERKPVDHYALEESSFVVRRWYS